MIADLIPKIAGMDTQDHKYYPRPSLAGPQRCIRSLVYWGLNIPPQPLPGRAILTFDDSSWHEELTMDWLRKSTYQLHSEQMHVDIPTTLDFLEERQCRTCQRIIPAKNLAGHIDWILTDLQGEDIFCEHKAINHFTFQKYRNGEELPLDYLTQVSLYLKGLLNLNPNIKKALLVIKNKNTAQYLEYQIIINDADDLFIDTIQTSIGETVEVKKQLKGLSQDAIEKFQKVHDYIQNKTLPRRQYEIGSWRCEYCRWGEICWQGWENEVEQMTTDAVLDEEIETMAHYYLELNMHIQEMTKEKEELKQKIKDLLKEKNIRSGRAGEYVIILQVQHKKEFVVPAKSYEVLTIRKPKKLEVKNGTR